MMIVWHVLLWLGAVSWALIFFHGLINLLFVRDVSSAEIVEPGEWPFITILAPARDEEQLIREAVASFCTQDYPRFEVIVVDDRSTDATPRILAELQQEYHHLKVLRGHEPPEGWLGKPNALQTGWKEAEGDWILMVDADVVYRPDVLRRGVAFTLHEGTAMGVLQPRTESKGMLESILMSGFNLFIFVITPLFLARHLRGKAFAAGSPAFNLIRRDVLEKAGGFACIRNAVVDDSAIGHYVKGKGHMLAVGYAGSMIKRRMYQGAAEAVRGFTKLLFPTIRKVPWLFPLHYAFGATLSLVPYVAFTRSLLQGTINVPASISLVLTHTLFAMLTIRLRQPWYITFCNPVREVVWWWIFARSFIVYSRRGLVWRGRSYSISR